MERVLTKNINVPNSYNIDVYMEHGGYEATRKALLEHKPAELIDMVKKSGLRGRGGAGFPAGLKWSFMPQGDEVDKYLCVNMDEGEPGTFKDRYLVAEDPHQVLEGVIIAAYAVGANRAFVYIRGEFLMTVKRWIKVIADAYAKGFLGENILGTGFNLDVSVHRGAGAYICGEETAMINSLEGKRGEPRMKPPYPAQQGLYDQPTLVNNVETLSCVPHIVLNGPEWFASIGTEKSAGPKMFCISGHVNKPGNYELPLGTTLRELIYDHAGGVKDSKKIKAIIPGGASTSLLTEKDLDVPLAFETLVEKGSSLGTGAVIVMDEDTDIVHAMLIMARFFAHESCGRCGPCRVGTREMVRLMELFDVGEGTPHDLELLRTICEQIPGKTFCPLGEASVNPIVSSIDLFKEEYEQRMKQ